MAIDWTIALFALCSAVVTVSAAFLILPRLPDAASGQMQDDPGNPRQDAVFLFRNQDMIDATPAAHRLLGQAQSGLGAWQRLAAVLAHDIPDFTQQIAALPDPGQTVIHDKKGIARASVSLSRGVTRIVLTSPVEDCQQMDDPSIEAMRNELTALRRVSDHQPTLSWQQDEQGNIIWANHAYLQRARLRMGFEHDLCWPLPHLFETAGGTRRDEGLAPQRASLTMPDTSVHWFDLSATPTPGGPLFFAQPADAAVQAETALRIFRQTLTKTFADLPIGIAIFNRARELVMFNPALTDLCALEPQYLVGRPSLSAFLDTLREKHMMPEPKNYKTWRQKMSALEQEAVDGTYQEVWSLPSGQTYRVSGQPHPDGAVAFLFEDISAEISLTRRFRTELEMGQAVIDGMENAIAVFSAAGVLSMSNAAYARLWDFDPSVSLCEISIQEAMERWRDACRPTGLWDEVRQGVSRLGERQPLGGAVQMQDGRSLGVSVVPISGNATIISFAESQGRIGTRQVLYSGAS